MWEDGYIYMVHVSTFLCILETFKGEGLGSEPFMGEEGVVTLRGSEPFMGEEGVVAVNPSRGRRGCDVEGQ